MCYNRIKVLPIYVKTTDIGFEIIKDFQNTIETLSLLDIENLTIKEHTRLMDYEITFYIVDTDLEFLV